MKRGPLVLPLMLFLSAALGGCLGGGAPSIRSAAPVIEVPETYGSINGTVIDEELVGVPQVRVELNPTDVWTITDAQGRFRFNYVGPGIYELEARLLDLGAFTQKVTVSDGVEAQVTIYATFPPVTRPYNTTHVFQGYFGCNMDGFRCPGYPNANDRLSFPVPVSKNVTAALIELAWKPPPNTERLSYIRVSATYNEESLGRGNFGRSPYFKIGFGPEYFKNGEPGTFTANIRSERAEVNFYNPGFFLEQKVDVYVTIWYVEDQMKGFTAIPPP